MVSEIIIIKILNLFYIFRKLRIWKKKITIEINKYDDNIIVEITDNGIGFGIFAKNIKDILNPYFTTKKNGTGLGLSIVNKIINDHNGKIEFIPIDDGAKVQIYFNLNDSRNINSWW